MNPGSRKTFFCSLKSPDRLRVAPGPSSEVRWAGREIEEPPSSCAEVKNELNYTSDPRVCLYDVDRDNFAFVYQ